MAIAGVCCYPRLASLQEFASTTCHAATSRFAPAVKHIPAVDVGNYPIIPEITAAVAPHLNVVMNTIAL